MCKDEAVLWQANVRKRTIVLPVVLQSLSAGMCLSLVYKITVLHTCFGMLSSGGLPAALDPSLHPGPKPALLEGRHHTKKDSTHLSLPSSKFIGDYNVMQMFRSFPLCIPLIHSWGMRPSSSAWRLLGLSEVLDSDVGTRQVAVGSTVLAVTTVLRFVSSVSDNICFHSKILKT